MDDASKKPAREMRRLSGILRKRAEEILAACKADTDAAAREFVAAAHVAVASAVASAFSTLARDEEEAAVPEKEEEEDEAAAKASKAIVRNAIQSIVAAERDAEYHRMAAQLEQAKQLNDELEAKLAEASTKLAEASTKLVEALNQTDELRWSRSLGEFTDNLYSLGEITDNLYSLSNQPAAESDAGWGAAGAGAGSVPIFQSLDDNLLASAPAPLPETDDDPPSGVATTAVYDKPPPAPSSLAGDDSAEDLAALFDFLLESNDIDIDF